MNQPAETLAQRDEKLIWHPFTQMKTAGPNIPIVRAEGALLFDENNKSYIDAISSWWVNLHGHAHPHIAHCIGEQAKKLPHVMFAGLTHEPAVQLCERLRRWLPVSLKRFFFSDNGSTAVEIAIKMALQFCHAAESKENEPEPKNTKSRRKPNRDQPPADPLPFKIIAFEGGYHGDTFGAMAVGERDVFIKPYLPYLLDVITIPAPTPGNERASRRALKRALEGERVAAMIFEPLIQAAFGMQTHEPEILDDMVKMCRDAQVFTIADEVMTGFFRTGSCFAIHQLKTAVDFICIGKALSGGTLPLALTVTTDRVFNAFYDDEKSKAFFHGHSYTANPIACAAALASLDVMESGGFKPTYGRVAEYLKDQAETYREDLKSNDSKFAAVRQKGLMLALELKVETKEGYLSDLGPRLYREAMKRGVMLRPLGEVIYVLPPVCISDEQLDHTFNVIDEIVHVV